MRPTFAVVIAALFVVGALASVYAVMQGGVLSKSKLSWSVEVDAQKEGPWRVEVPRVVNATDAPPEAIAALDALMGTLRVTRGEAVADLLPRSLSISGDGDATVVASQTLERGVQDFLVWNASGDAVSRVQDPAGPFLTVTWSIDFTGGGGHACRAAASYTQQVPPNEVRRFSRPATAATPSDVDPGTLWKVVCS